MTRLIYACTINVLYCFLHTLRRGYYEFVVNTTQVYFYRIFNVNSVENTFSFTVSLFAEFSVFFRFQILIDRCPRCVTKIKLQFSFIYVHFYAMTMATLSWESCVLCVFSFRFCLFFFPWKIDHKKTSALKINAAIYRVHI